jgi:hypothetical protein
VGRIYDTAFDCDVSVTIKKQGERGRVGSLPSSLAFIEVDIDALQLKFIISNVCSSGVNSMFSGHNLR